jgi:hypothetical protein
MRKICTILQSFKDAFTTFLSIHWFYPFDLKGYLITMVSKINVVPSLELK